MGGPGGGFRTGRSSGKATAGTCAKKNPGPPKPPPGPPKPKIALQQGKILFHDFYLFFY